jgi:hypothetical protein
METFLLILFAIICGAIGIGLGGYVFGLVEKRMDRRKTLSESSQELTNELLRSINFKLSVLIFVFVFIPLVWAIFFD